MKTQETTLTDSSDLVIKTGQALHGPMWLAVAGIIAGHVVRLKTLFYPEFVDPGFNWSMALPFFVIAAITAGIVVYSVFQSRRQFSISDQYYDRQGDPDRVTWKLPETQPDDDIYSDV
mgnify:CR=1 FL=1